MAFRWFGRKAESGKQQIDLQTAQLFYAFAYQYLSSWFFQVPEAPDGLNKLTEPVDGAELIRALFASMCAQCNVRLEQSFLARLKVDVARLVDRRIVAVVAFPEPPPVDVSKQFVLAPYFAGLVWTAGSDSREYYVVGQSLPVGELPLSATIRRVQPGGGHGRVSSIRGIPTSEAFLEFLKSTPATSDGGRYAGLLARGRSLLQQGKTTEGLEAVEEAIRLNSSDPTAFKLRAAARHHVLRDYPGAVADLDQVLRKNPNDLEALELRARTRSLMPGQEDLALADLDQIIRLSPTAVAYQGRSTLLSRKKETMKAIADLGEAIRLEPNESYLWKSRGLLWAEVNEPDHFERAIADFEQANRLNPDNDVHVLYLAASWEYATSPIVDRRDGRKALHYVQQAREVEAGLCKEACYFRALAAAHAEAGDFEQAVAAETTAHELYSNEDRPKWGHLLDLYRSGQAYREQPGAVQ